jgi:hypothetical protein
VIGQETIDYLDNELDGFIGAQLLHNDFLRVYYTFGFLGVFCLVWIAYKISLGRLDVLVGLLIGAFWGGVFFNGSLALAALYVHYSLLEGDKIEQ